MHVALDLDDVILDFVGGLRTSIKKEYGIDIPDQAVEQWELGPVLNPVIGYSWWDWLKDRSWLWSNFPAVDGAIGGIERLRHDGHYLEIVTSKPDWATHNVWKWMGKWRPKVHRVTIVGQNDLKRDFTEAEVLVDDKIDNLFGFEYPILFTRPHNKNLDSDWRANNWQEVVEIINGWNTKQG